MTRSPLLSCAFILFAIPACAGVQQRETVSFEQTLAASGFQMRLADTPDKLAQLEKLPQQRLLTQDEDGTQIFLYADAEGCKCLYIGGQNALDNYRKMVAEQDEADERAEAAATLPASTDPDWLDVDDYADPAGWAPWW